MLPQDRVLTLVARIYDAASDAQLWPAFLDDFADAVNATTTALLFYNWSAPVKLRWIATRFDPHFARLYAEYYSGVNPWLKSWQRSLNRPGPESIGVSEQRVEFAALQKTEFYNDYLRPQDTVHQMACMLGKREKLWSGFTCLRPRSAGPFDRAEVELLEILYPHLERGVQFQEGITKLAERERAALDVLDSLPNGVLLLDGSGRILVANRAARQVLDQNDGLHARAEGLSTATTAETAEVRSAIAAAGATARGEGVSAGGSFAITRPSGKRPLSLTVMPLSRGAFPGGASQAVCAAFVADPECAPVSAPETLSRIFQLTAAESRVAERLMQGETLQSTAEQLGVSHNTVRTHLQKIYEKTGTSHQAGLVRLLLSGIPQVSH